MNEKKLQELFGMIPSKNKEPEIILPDGSSPVDHDYEFVRNKLKDAVEQGIDFLADSITVAKASQHPEHMKAVATIIKSVVDGGKALADVNANKVLIKGNVDSKTKTNNYFMVGSTKDLQDMLKAAKKAPSTIEEN